MNPSVISAVAALAGAAIGGCTSVGTTWLSQQAQAKAQWHWVYPFGTADMHVALAIYAKDDVSLEQVLERAQQSHRELPQISVVYRLKFSELPGGFCAPVGAADRWLTVMPSTLRYQSIMASRFEVVRPKCCSFG